MIKRSGLVLFFIFLTSCAAGPDYRAPEDSVAAEFVRADTPVFAPGEPEHDWWRLLNDPLLDDLIGQALIANKDLRAANANIRASRALLRRQKFDALPTCCPPTPGSIHFTMRGLMPRGSWIFSGESLAPQKRQQLGTRLTLQIGMRSQSA